MEEHPGEPLPGAASRMRAFDALPRGVRVAVANLPFGIEKSVAKATTMLRAGKPIPAIIKAVNRISDERETNVPAEKAVAEAFRAELGL